MPASFRDQVAVVTGGGAGLGAAFARALAAAGARAVVAVDVRFLAPAGAGVEQIQLDICEEGALARLLADVAEKYGRLDLMINNAGVSVDGEPLAIPFSEWQRVVRVNLLGVIDGSLAALRIMAAQVPAPGQQRGQTRGTILNIGSLTGLALTPLLGPYSSAKAGVVTFTRGLAEEAVGLGVSVSVACPGNIATSILPEHVSGLMKPMNVDYAATRILAEATQGTRIIVFPLYARTWWWLERVSPQLLAPLRQVIVNRSRARAAAKAAGQV